MKTIGLIFFFTMIIYGFCYGLPIKLRLMTRLDKEFSPKKIKELAEMGDPDAKKIIRGEKIMIVLGAIAVVCLFLSKFGSK